MRECDCDGGPGPLVHDQRSGDTICTACACVVEALVFDERPEWFEDRGARATGPGRDAGLLPQDNGAVFAGKRKFSGEDSHKRVRLGLREVERCAGLVGIATEHAVTQVAKEYYRDFAAVRVVREPDRTAAAAAAVYFGCKTGVTERDRVPRTMEEIAGACELALRDVSAQAKVFKQALVGKDYYAALFHTVVAGDVLVRAVGNVPATVLEGAKRQRVLARGRQLQELITRQGLLEGRTPAGVCSAVLYLAMCGELGGHAVHKPTVYRACNVAGATMAKALDELAQSGVVA